MVLRTRPEEDEWHDVTDAKKRKQIQDRLAQRARRRRLRAAQGDITASQQLLKSKLARDGPSPNQDQVAAKLAVMESRNNNDSERSSNTPAPNWPSLELIDQDVADPVTVDLQTRSDREQVLAIASPSWQLIDLIDQDVTNPAMTGLQPNNKSEDSLDWQLVRVDPRSDLPLPDSTSPETSLTHPSLLPSNIHALPSPLSTNLTLPLTVFTALFLNGQILSIPCSTIIASKSPPPSLSTPFSLRPTASQLTTVHYQWIDRLPFPKLRDSLIKLQAVLDLDEFLQDIFVAPSFEIEKGGRSWEAGKWRMEEGWRGKWGWLFF